MLIFYYLRTSPDSYHFFTGSLNNGLKTTFQVVSILIGYAQTNLLEGKIALFATAFFILIPAATWAGLIAANFLFGYLWFWWIQ